MTNSSEDMGKKLISLEEKFKQIDSEHMHARMMKYALLSTSYFMAFSMLALFLTLSTIPAINAPVNSADLTEIILPEYAFRQPAMEHAGEYDIVRMEDLENFGEAGKPMLPVKTVRVLVPIGKEVQSIMITGKNKTRIKGNYLIEPGIENIPVGYKGVINAAKPDPEIYSSDLPYPGKTHKEDGTYKMTGYDIFVLELNPVEYSPNKGEVSYYQAMEVKITLRNESGKSKNKRNLAGDAMEVMGLVDNPDTIKTYPSTSGGDDVYSTSGSVNPAESYKYVIITNSQLMSAFQPLIDWKKTRTDNPITATIVQVEDIVAEPAYWCGGAWGDGCNNGTRFNDTQAKIRNFIKDAYANWETEYVLLGGDDEIIPVRYLYNIYYEYSAQIPADTYYASLDGNWNNDGDGYWGEESYYSSGEEADLYAEISIGRATVDNQTEAINFVNKTIAYEQAVINESSYLRKATMVGETLDNRTEGGNSKDLVANMLTGYTINKLYTRDGTYSGTAVRNAINNGTHIVNHLGHSNYASVMGQSGATVDALTNTKYCLVYSIGCYSAAFDNTTSGNNEAVAEHFILDNNGAFAYIGNSRYGWYAANSTSGTGDRYDRSFFDAIINERIRPVGKALKDSKEDMIGSGFQRWTHYTINLLGDPETRIYINETGSTTTTSTTTTTTSTTTSSTTTTTLQHCRLDGDTNPCETVTLHEVVSYMQNWTEDQATLIQVVDLIHAWENK
jgi:hypothetical protein